VNTNRPVIQPKPKGERPLSLDMDEFEEEFDEIGTTGDGVFIINITFNQNFVIK